MTVLVETMHDTTTTRFSSFNSLARAVFLEWKKNQEGIKEKKLKDQYELLNKIARIPSSCQELYSQCPTAFFPENIPKNRYSNVLPIESTRVRLLTGSSDYINANHISSQVPKSFNHFITCQAPIPNTFEDFWRMIWEQNSGLIVMLTNLFENCKKKADQYWPELDKSEIYGDFVVECKSIHILESSTIRLFKISYQDQVREIIHIHFKEWPDFGTPQGTEKIGALVNKISIYKQLSRKKGLLGPLVVHCSAGLGRSGTLIGILICVEKLQNQISLNELDLFDIVKKMRDQRSGMIQTLDQFIFLHRVVSDLSKDLKRITLL